MNAFTQPLDTVRLAVINTGSGAVYEAFCRLFRQNAPPIAYLHCRRRDISAALAQCEEHGVFALVLGVNSIPLPVEPFSAVAITPSVSIHWNYFRQLVTQPTLERFAMLGCQSYLMPPEEIQLLQSFYFETLRLSALHDDLPVAEPLLRDADYAWFDVGAIRAADAPGASHHEPNGLYAEEACKLMYYAGLSNRTKVLLLHGYRRTLGTWSLTARLVGQLIWHLAEGLGMRVSEDLPKESGHHAFKEFVVDMGVRGRDLYFLQSVKTQRWWMKIYDNKETMRWIACAPSDYQTACKGEIPARWLWYYQKSNN